MIFLYMHIYEKSLLSFLVSAEPNNSAAHQTVKSSANLQQENFHLNDF